MDESLLLLNEHSKFRFIHTSDGVIVKWTVFPSNILVVHKFCDESVIDDLKQLVTFVLQTWNVCVFLQSDTIEELKKDVRFYTTLNQYMEGVLKSFDPQDLSVSSQHKMTVAFNTNVINRNSSVKIFECRFAADIDMVVCLGGDGTLLKIGSLFQRPVPPVLAFRLGTLGFLTPVPFKSFPTSMRYAMEGSPHCLMRMRLCCQILRGPDSGGLSDSSNGSRGNSPDTQYHFLNELVVDRGLSPCSCDLILKVNGRVVTHFEGDGLIVSTPTGSTAYSMAAGASMVHPCVSAFLLTPINSLTLSSRAIVLPLSLRVEICINPTARCKVVHFSFDGRSRASNLLRDGDSIVVSGSPYPVPCLSGEDQGVEWFCGLHHLLNWNTRSRRTSTPTCSDAGGYYDATGGSA